MMSTAKIAWRQTIDLPWLGIPPARIGDILPGSGEPDMYILVSQDGKPVIRVDAYRNSDECYAFYGAVVWHGFLVIGWGHYAYLVEIESGAVTRHALGTYFGHIHANDEFLLITSGDRLRRIHSDGSLNWISARLGIDGVVISNVANGFISGDGEWDPPGGWQPFRISLETGQNAT